MLPERRINGAVAELMVTADLTRRGFFPYAPVMENTECDLVVDALGELFKVQIKSAHSDGDKIKIDLKRSSAKDQFYTKDDFDILAIYDSTTTKIAYIAWDAVPYKRNITLRFTETTIGNGCTDKFGRMYFDDLIEFPSLSVLGNRSTNANDGGNRQAI